MLQDIKQIRGATSGSILFLNTSGIVSENNSMLYWDDTNFRLGINTNIPGYSLEVNGTASYTTANTLTLDTEFVHKKYVDDLIPIQATESSAGIAEIATQAETDAGTDDLRFVTPLKLSNTLSNNQSVQTTNATTTILPSSKVIASNTHNYFETTVLGVDITSKVTYVSKFKGSIKNNAGTVSIPDEITIELITSETGSSTWLVTFVAENTTDTLDIYVTGEVGKTINWKSFTEFKTISMI